MPTGTIFDIQRYCVNDGPGIRTTLFFKGCPLDCWWCHNPESKSALVEIAVDPHRCIRCGACAEACPQGLDGTCLRCGACADACPTTARTALGRQITVDEALAEVLKDRIFHEDSGGGVTCSGGEPLMQPGFLGAFLRACNEQGVHTALDTCGYAPESALLAAAALADVVLYDLKLVDDVKHRRYTGVSNDVILRNLTALAGSHPTVWLRIPLIPGVNDSESDLEALIGVAAGLPGLRRICLLPYHATGAGKLGRLGYEDRLGAVHPPPAERMAAIAGRFRARGLQAHVGG